MKLVWENGSATVQAPKKLRSAFQRSPDADRANFGRSYHIGTVGAWQIQADIEAYQESKRQDKIRGFMDWLDTVKPES